MFIGTFVCLFGVCLLFDVCLLFAGWFVSISISGFRGRTNFSYLHTRQVSLATAGRAERMGERQKQNCFTR